MKTINLKDTFKLFLFLLILFSAKAFSFTKLPTDANSSGFGSRIGCASEAPKPKTASRGYSMQSKNTALKRSVAHRASLKFGW